MSPETNKKKKKKKVNKIQKESLPIFSPLSVKTPLFFDNRNNIQSGKKEKEIQTPYFKMTPPLFFVEKGFFFERKNNF